MAVLTYDNASPEAGAEFNADEQESLKVGEALAGEQSELLAGKFTSAEELARAYKELESKLGQRGQEEEAEPTEDAQEEASDEVDISFLDRLYEEATNDDEGFSEELLAELGKYDKEDIAQMFLEYRHRQGEQQPQAEPQEMSQEDEAKVMDAIGGPERYESMIKWASQNLTQQEQDMYDSVMQMGNPLAAFFAAQALAYRFQDSQDVEGEMVTGRAPASAPNAFRSQQELVTAMADPRYDRDPAYREDVMRKLENSPELNF